MLKPEADPPSACAFDCRSSGLALFACLALLLVLSIAGTSAVRTAMLEARMVRNAEDALLALQAAEVALGEGEAYLSGSGEQAAPFAGGAGLFSDAGAAGLWTVSPSGQTERWAQSTIWAPRSTRSRVANTALAWVVRQPRYIVEWLATLDTAGDSLLEESIGEAVGGGNASGNNLLAGESAGGVPLTETSADDVLPAEGRERLEIFRITALGVGRTELARAMVQSTYGILIRDEGDCSYPPPGPTIYPDGNGRSVLYAKGADCRHSVVASGAAEVGRLSWREIQEPGF